MGGSLDMVQRAFAGVHILSDRVKINPRLPKAWRKLHLKLFCRGHWMEFWINHHRITCVLESSPQKPFPLPVEIGGKRVDGIGNQKRSFSYRSHIESI
ncbi:MAG: hypothetical protein JW893_04585 [Candidatus Omnitrophica bacterium]|nr:hypothetical protein [Candidatus Omnitrophota bacterium]